MKILYTPIFLRGGRGWAALGGLAALLAAPLFVAGSGCSMDAPSTPVAAERTADDHAPPATPGGNAMSTSRVTGRVERADRANFETAVLHSEVPVLVDFYADWCGPCQRLAPTLDALARELDDARIVKVNVDDSPELARRYGVQSIPSLKVFRDGRVVAEHVGLASREELRAMLDL